MKNKTVFGVAEMNLFSLIWIACTLSESIQDLSWIFQLIENGAILHKVSFSITKFVFMFDMAVRGNNEIFPVRFFSLPIILIETVLNIWIMVVHCKDKKSKLEEAL